MLSNKSDKEQVELLNKVLKNKVTEDILPLIKRRIQLYNMYPDNEDIETWDTKDSEELFEIDYQIEIIRHFENL